MTRLAGFPHFPVILSKVGEAGSHGGMQLFEVTQYQRRTQESQVILGSLYFRV